MLSTHSLRSSNGSLQVRPGEGDRMTERVRTFSPPTGRALQMGVQGEKGLQSLTRQGQGTSQDVCREGG